MGLFGSTWQTRKQFMSRKVESKLCRHRKIWSRGSCCKANGHWFQLKVSFAQKSVAAWTVPFHLDHISLRLTRCYANKGFDKSFLRALKIYMSLPYYNKQENYLLAMCMVDSIGFAQVEFWNVYDQGFTKIILVK